MSRIMIATWTGMNADPLALLGSEALEHTVVQLNECFQDAGGRIELERQSALSEVDLYTGSTRVQALTYVLFRITNKITKESIARIVGKTTLRIKQTQRGCRNHSLFYRPVRVPLGGFEVSRGMNAVAKRTCRQSR